MRPCQPKQPRAEGTYVRPAPYGFALGALLLCHPACRGERRITNGDIRTVNSDRSPCSGQRSAAERGEPAIRKSRRASRKKNVISVEGTLLKQALNYIEAPSKKASSKNPT